ncbi:hypothetical protein AB0C34_17885 [Nocardia sp. NPDC049220]|uniref:hypothetical protein n=1 Tax=Nocardia sp. NPDC049220 TaxID=3155273 RepID=UPI0033EFEC78
MGFDLPSFIAVDTLAGPDAVDGVVIRSDLLPPNTHGSNLRGLLTRQMWDRLRTPVCDAAGNRCEICGVQTIRNRRPARPDCHEKWAFKFVSGRLMQQLQRLIALCPGCHQVQHVGRARMNGFEAQVIFQLRELNGWTAEQAAEDLDRASHRVAFLHRFDWDLDLSALTGQLLIENYPQLYIPAVERPTLGNSYFRLPPAVRSSLT